MNARKQKKSLDVIFEKTFNLRISEENNMLLKLFKFQKQLIIGNFLMKLTKLENSINKLIIYSAGKPEKNNPRNKKKGTKKKQARNKKKQMLSKCQKQYSLTNKKY